MTREEIEKKIDGTIELMEATFAIQDVLPVMMKISDEDAFTLLISALTYAWCQIHGKKSEPEHAQMHLDIAKTILDAHERETKEKK